MSAALGGGSREDEPSAEPRPEVENVLAVRMGHGANCSSIGSVVDTLFATATVGGAVFAAIVAALKVEEVSVVSPVARAMAANDEAPPEKDG